MNIYYDHNISPPNGADWLFLDTNILSKLYYCQELVNPFRNIFSPFSIIIDSYIKFEFTRNEFWQENFDNKTKFLNTIPAVAEIQELDSETSVLENASLLSKIYTYKLGKKGGSIPVVDLLLMARVMNYDHSLLLTADKQDFTTIVFDRINIFTFEDRDDHLTHIQLLKFNQDKFKQLQDKIYSVNTVSK